MADQSPLDSLKTSLKEDAPDIARALYDVLAPRAFNSASAYSQPKRINDPIWRIIELQPWEAAALDLPLMQRLRRVRQLGMAHVVYPSAQHSRFEHSLGALAAATQMFDALSVRAGVNTSEINFIRLRKCVRLAALFHDCGHGAFSHVSERVIAKHSLFGPQFKAAKTALDNMFSTTTPGVLDGPAPLPPTAELLSALFLLTPQMSQFLTSQACGLDLDDQLRIAALVLGRSYSLITTLGGSDIELDFVKGLISGDLDADKMDYVARDAYFAGIPIAADVHRLISQLDVISVPEPAGATATKKMAVMAVRLPGVSAVEMFILTRAYLFDRIYQHPKIRAAECVLEATFKNRFSKNDGKNYDCNDLINLIYHPGGDDYCMGILEESITLLPGDVSLYDRKLPRRVLALSPRFAIGYAPNRRDWSAMLRRAWDNVLVKVPDNMDALAAAISKLADDNSLVVIDMPRKSALKENPELYVRRSQGHPEDISQHFDAAQFSAAYESVKKTVWVFSDHADPAKVAAAASLTFMAQFGIVPSEDGLLAAKIEPKEYSRALDELSAKDVNHIAPLVDELRRAQGDKLSLPILMLSPLLPIGDSDECLMAASILAEELASSNLTKSNIDDLDAALVAVRWLIKHEKVTAEVKRRNNLSLVESTFQDEVEEFLRTNARDDIDLEPESDNSAGRADFSLRLLGGRMQIALELKSEKKLFAEIIEKRLAQPFHYTSDPRYGRVAILYARFRDDRARRPIEDFSVHCLPNDRAPMILICIGQRTMSKPASGQKASTAETKKVAHMVSPGKAGTAKAKKAL